MVQTTDFDLCQQYLAGYVENLKTQLNECQLELMKQSESCFITHVTLDQIDDGLKEFVDTQRKYLCSRNDRQLDKLKSSHHCEKLYKALSHHGLIQEQVSVNQFEKSVYIFIDNYSLLKTNSIHRLMDLRQHQADIWKHLLILEMRILCKFLPDTCDHLEHCITPVVYMPLNTNQKAIDLKNQCYKIIREAKRTWLNHVLRAYESEIQEYEQLYQTEFKHLEASLSNPTTTDNTSPLPPIKDYLVERTNQLRGTMSDEVSSSRIMLLRNHQRASSSKDTIGISPQPYLDLISNPFNQREWNYLCLGKWFSWSIILICVLSSILLV